MPSILTSKVTTKGQTTIPAEVRYLLDLNAGDEIVYIPHKKGFIISKAKKDEKICPCCQGSGRVSKERGDEK